METSPELRGLLEWTVLAVLALGAAAAAGAALFGGLAALLRIRDSSLSLLGRLVGIAALVWFASAKLSPAFCTEIAAWWRLELTMPSNDAVDDTGTAP